MTTHNHDVQSDTVKLLSGQVVHRQKLSAEERAKPYAKFFDVPMAPPDPANVARVMSGPLDPAQALSHAAMNDLLLPGYLETEVGYCKLPDGVGYMSSILQMPGVTAEMFDWWFAWHPLESLRYKIWHPHIHYSVRVSEQDHARLTNRDIPVRERVWGTTHHVNEDIGGGAIDISIPFLSPEAAGFDMQRFVEPNVATAICSDVFVHFVRRVAGGTELRTRFWLPPFFTEPMLRGLNLHCLEEFTRLAAILPALYAEEKNNV